MQQPDRTVMATSEDNHVAPVVCGASSTDVTEASPRTRRKNMDNSKRYTATTVHMGERTNMILMNMLYFCQFVNLVEEGIALAQPRRASIPTGSKKAMQKMVNDHDIRANEPHIALSQRTQHRCPQKFESGKPEYHSI